MLTHGFRRQRFADAWRPGETDHKTMPLAGYEVAENLVARLRPVVSAHFYEGAQEGLAIFLEDETFEGFCIPGNVFDVIHIEGH